MLAFELLDNVLVGADVLTLATPGLFEPLEQATAVRASAATTRRGRQ
jgi:hypothetical protein